MTPDLLDCRRGAVTLPAVPAHELALGQDVTFHGRDQLVLRRAGGQVERRVQRVELEKVAMRLAPRRGRAAVADVAEVVLALLRAAGKLLLGRHAFGQLAPVAGEVEEHPVDPGAARRVGVVADQGEARGPLRRVRPAQGGRYIPTGPRVP